jgi:hypothetical protein
MNVSSLYSAWPAQRAEIEALLRSGPASNDFEMRSLHDDIINTEVDVQPRIETKIEDCAEASKETFCHIDKLTIFRAICRFPSGLYPGMILGVPVAALFPDR